MRRASRILGIAAATAIVFFASAAHAQRVESFASRPLYLLLALAALSLLPFVFMTLTSFVKISVVFSILRSAIGTPQIPPGTVITGLAAILTLYVMSPVIVEIKEAINPLLERQTRGDLLSRDSADVGIQAAMGAREPVRRFLRRNSSPRNRTLFYDLARRSRPAAQRPEVGREDMLILAPAFITTELEEAFQIGFLVFLPFLIIDMVIANILLALGMHMLSPTTISLPFKLLLFVLVSGWSVLAQGLVLGYR